MVDIILELSFIVAIAAVLAIFAKFIKQPPIIAYLIAGVILGPVFFGLIKSTEVLEIFAQLGVAFLLFIVGLSLDFRILREVGKVSFVVGIGQVIITSIVGFLIVIGLGYDFIPALYVAVAISISSTFVVIKLLSEKSELETLHGKIIIGVLIIQDLIATFVLMIAPFLSTGDLPFILTQLAKGVLLILGVFVFSKTVLPMFFKSSARSQELLFLLSIGWALVISSIFGIVGFSLKIGALFAGMSLASSIYSLEIRSKIKDLRDFFIVIFFVYFGSKLIAPWNMTMITHALLLSLFVLIFVPIIVMALMRPFGYKKRTNFMTGIGIAQISEFSLILVLLGFELGVLGQPVLSLTILVALITIALSSYTIHYAQPIFTLVSPLLGIFDGKGHKIDSNKKPEDYEIVMFGHNRIGFSLVKAFEAQKKKYLIVDFNPKTIDSMKERNINCIYGDANDLELLKELNLSKTKMIISTIPDLKTNLRILRTLKNKREVSFIATSHYFEDTEALYKEGVDYVIMPHFLGGEHVAHMLIKDNFRKNEIRKSGQRQLKDMFYRISEGHSHPTKDSHGD